MTASAQLLKRPWSLAPFDQYSRFITVIELARFLLSFFLSLSIIYLTNQFKNYKFLLINKTVLNLYNLKIVKLYFKLLNGTNHYKNWLVPLFL
jgi:hypothetical protein